MSIAIVIAQDLNLIPYRKELNKITGGITATILLQQIIYWHHNSKGEFYKFIEPCKHEKYKQGDSWVEELGFSRKEFVTACSKLEKAGLISKKTDRSRLTRYKLNDALLEDLLSELYSSKGFTKMPKGDLPKSEKGFTKMPKGDLPKSEKGFTKMPKGDLPLYTETTTETTTDIITRDKSRDKKSLDYSDWILLNNNQTIDEQLLQDWLQLRKLKKAAVSQTVINQAAKQFDILINQYGFTLEQCLTEWIARGWQGFKAEWLINDLKTGVMTNARRKPNQSLQDKVAAATSEQYRDILDGQCYDVSVANNDRDLWLPLDE